MFLLFVISYEESANNVMILNYLWICQFPNVNDLVITTFTYQSDLKKWNLVKFELEYNYDDIHIDCGSNVFANIILFAIRGPFY